MKCSDAFSRGKVSNSSIFEQKKTTVVDGYTTVSDDYLYLFEIILNTLSNFPHFSIDNNERTIAYP